MSNQPLVSPQPTPTSWTLQQVKVINNNGREELLCCLRLHTHSGGSFTFWEGRDLIEMGREMLRLGKLTDSEQMDPTLVEAISAATQPRTA